MRRLISFLIFGVLLALSMNSQTLHFEENFDYDLGKLPDVSTDWIYNPDGSFDIEVIDGNLNYSGYEASNIGRKINLDGGASGRTHIQRSFPLISSNGNSVYVSFLLNVTSTSDMDVDTSAGDYFAFLAPSSGTAYRNKIHVRQGSGASKFSIGLAKTSDVEWYSTELDVGVTYLIVMSYHFQAGDDEARLWINPTLAGAEPTPDISLTLGSDASDLNHLKFGQRPSSGDMDIDGIRVSDSWEQAPLPVELTSFNAEFVDNSVRLNWETATEVNNFGFDVERKYQVSSSEYQDWEKIGFVEGNGTTNSPREYSFTDDNLPDADNVSYRLKQIDIDGKYSYSKVVEVNLTEITGVEDDKQYTFALEQNYPNPFNPVTTISYTIPNVVDAKSASVTNTKLIVYNILGQQVQTLVNEIKPAGNYQVQFDGSNLPSGIYFYTLSYGEFLQTRKLVLLK